MVFVTTFADAGIVHERRIYGRGGLMLQLAGEVGDASETARVYGSTLYKALLAHEVSVAAQIQRALLPPAVSADRGLEVAAASIPCRMIGGDFLRS